MLKRLSSSWLLGSIAVGIVGVACTVTTKDDDDDGTGGKGSTGGASSSGGSTSMGGNTSPEGGMDAGGDTGSEGGRGGGTAAGGKGGGTSGGGTGTGEGGAGGGEPPPSVEDLFDCDDRSTTGATVVDEHIMANTTWSGTISVPRTLHVRDGATLTIEPGTQIVMGPDATLDVGWNSGAATVKALGTPTNPVRFCGAQGDPGFWHGVIVGSNVTSNSQLHNVLISDAGSEDAALTLNANIEIKDVHVRNSEKNGVEAFAFSEGSSGLSVEGASGVAVLATHSDAIHYFPLGGTFANNGENIVSIGFTSIDADATFADVGIPYQQEGSLQIRKAKVVINPGVTYLMGADSVLDVGWNSNAASFTAVGTEDAPILFRGASEEPGFWAGIIVGANVTTNSSFSNVEIHHGGGDGAYAIEVHSPITLDSVLLTDNEQGAYIGVDGLSEDSKNLSITKTENVALTVEPNALVSLPQGGDFTGNTSDEIHIKAGNYDQIGTVPNLGVPYRVLGNLRTYKSSMTLTKGSRFIMSADSDFEFGWNSNEATIVAVGTAAEPIQFVGADAQSGFWTGLLVGGNVLSASKFDYVEVSHAAAACITLRSSVAVTNSSFSDCGYGILREEADTRDYAATNTFTNMTDGNVGSF